MKKGICIRIASGVLTAAILSWGNMQTVPAKTSGTGIGSNISPDSAVTDAVGGILTDTSVSDILNTVKENVTFSESCEKNGGGAHRYLESDAGTPLAVKGKKATKCVNCGKYVVQDDTRSLLHAKIDKIADQEYTGAQICPVVTVRALDGTVLQMNRDYTVTYGENVALGIGTVKVAGTGVYRDEAVATFLIRPVNIEKAFVNSISAHACTGEEIRPGVAMTYYGRQLVENTDYTLVYKDNIKPGTAVITVNGMGNYTGSRTVNFQITANDMKDAVVSSVAPQDYTGSPLTPKVSVYYNQVLLVENQDYALSYSNNVNAGKAEITIVGWGRYSGTHKVSFEITGTDIREASVSAVGKKVYRGERIEPAVTVTCKGKTLTNGVDYSLRYSNNRNVGTAVITVQGRGAYSGTQSIKFAIIPKPVKFKSVKSADNRSAVLSWSKAAGGSGYEIYRSTNKSSGYQKIAAIKKNATVKYTDRKLKKGKKYYYKIRTYKTVDGRKYYSKFSAVSAVAVR